MPPISDHADAVIRGYLDTVHGIKLRHLSVNPLANSISELVMRLTSDINQFGFFTRQTLAAFEHVQWFDDAPLYALLHEPIYARG